MREQQVGRAGLGGVRREGGQREGGGGSVAVAVQWRWRALRVGDAIEDWLLVVSRSPGFAGAVIEPGRTYQHERAQGHASGNERGTTMDDGELC